MMKYIRFHPCFDVYSNTSIDVLPFDFRVTFLDSRI